MVSGFCKSDEAVAAYKKIGLSYPDEIYDRQYDSYLQETSKSPAKENKIKYQNVVRVVLPSGQQYIVHDQTDIRLDKIGNVKSFYRSGIGKHPVPTPQYSIQIDQEDGYSKKRVLSGVSSIEIVLSIPFNEKTADEIYKYCTGKTQYTIQKGENKGHRITVDSFEDFKKGEVEELLRFGHIANKVERQLLEEEKSGKTTVRPYS